MILNGTKGWFCFRHPAPQWILLTSLLVVELLGFCSVAGGAKTAEPPEPGGCVQSPTPQCVISMSLTAADKISGVQPRAETLIRIAEAQVEAGNYSEARRSLTRSLTAAAAIDKAAFLHETWIKTSPEDETCHARAQAFSDIAKLLTRLNEKARAQELFSRALNTAERIEASQLRAKSLLEIAKAQVATSALQQARETFNRVDIGKNAWYLPALRQLVRTQVEAGDVPGALRTARNIPKNEKRAVALAEIAAAQAAAGDMTGAGVTVKGIKHAYYRMVATHYLGTERAQNGDFAGAWDAVGEIVEIWRKVRNGWAGPRDMVILRDDTILAIVKSNIKAGRFGDAFAAAEKMEDNFAFVEAHAALAKAQTGIGDHDAARTTADAICGNYRYGGYCVEVLVGLAVAQESTGRAKDAQDTLPLAEDIAQRILYDDQSFLAHVAIYTAKLKMGDVEGARWVFNLALTAVAEFEDADAQERAERFTEMGAAALRTRDGNGVTRAFSEALNAASKIKEVNERIEMFVRAGLAQARAKYTDGARMSFSRALAVAGVVESATRRAKLLAGIAFALASGKCEKRTIFSDDPLAICMN